MSSVLVACMAPIALCHLTRDHLTRSLKSRNATVGDKTWNPGFKSVTLLKETGGLMDRSEFFLSPSCPPPHHHFPLQSELLGERNLDQFNALNSPVISIYPWRLWLLRYRQSRRPFSKIPTIFVHLAHHDSPLQSELLGGSILDQFDALNPPAVSIVLSHRWL